MNMTVKPGTTTKASLVDTLRVDHSASDIVRNARLLVGVLRSAEKTPEALKWATDHAMPAFLAAEQELAKLQGLPLRGTALAEAKEMHGKAAAAVTALEDATKNAGIPENALSMKLPYSIHFLKDALVELQKQSAADVQKRPVIADWNGSTIMMKHDDDPAAVLKELELKAFEADRNPKATPLGAAKEAMSALSRIVNKAASDEAFEKLQGSSARPRDEVVAWVTEKAYLKESPKGLARAAVNRLEHKGEIADMAKHLFDIAGDLGLQDRTGAPVPKQEAVRTLYDYMEAWIRADAQPQASAAWKEAHAAMMPLMQQQPARPTTELIAELSQYNADPAQRMTSLAHKGEITQVIDFLFANTKDPKALHAKIDDNLKYNMRPGTEQIWADALAKHT